MQHRSLWMRHAALMTCEPPSPSITRDFLDFLVRPSAASLLAYADLAAVIGQWRVRHARANRFESAGGRKPFWGTSPPLSCTTG